MFDAIWLIVFCGFMDVVFEFLCYLMSWEVVVCLSCGLWHILSFVVGGVEREGASWIVLV